MNKEIPIVAIFEMFKEAFVTKWDKWGEII